VDGTAKHCIDQYMVLFRYCSLGGVTSMPGGLHARLCHTFLVSLFCSAKSACNCADDDETNKQVDQVRCICIWSLSSKMMEITGVYSFKCNPLPFTVNFIIFRSRAFSASPTGHKPSRTLTGELWVTMGRQIRLLNSEGCDSKAGLWDW